MYKNQDLFRSFTEISFEKTGSCAENNNGVLLTKQIN